MAIGGVVLTVRYYSSGRKRAIIVATILVILTCNITCIATDPPDPRVHVNGYTRKDGTRVSGYSRRYPGREDVNSPYEALLSLVIIGAIVVCISACIKEKQREEVRLNQEHPSRDVISSSFSNNNYSQSPNIDLGLEQPSVSAIPGWFSEVMKLAVKIPISAHVVKNPDEIISIDKANTIRHWLIRYNHLSSSYITIHPRKNTKYLKYYIYGYDHNERTLEIFSTDPKKSYGYSSLTDTVQKICHQIDSSEFIVINKIASTDLCSMLNDHYRKALFEKAIIWDSDFIGTYGGSNVLESSIVRLLSVVQFGRFDKCHSAVCESFTSFNMDDYDFMEVENIQESSLKFFTKPYYEKIKSILWQKDCIERRKNCSIYYSKKIHS